MNASESGSRGKSASYSLSLTQLRTMLAPFVLRRLKGDVLDQLVPKECSVTKVTMTSFQSEVYNNVLVRHKIRRDRLRAEHEAATSDGQEDHVSAARTNGGDEKTRTGNVSDAAVACEAIVGKEDSDAREEPSNRKGKGKGEGAKLKQKDEDSTENVVMTSSLPELSQSEANSLFTALRKAANHPLLLRIRFQDDAKMALIAKTAYKTEYFGRQCSLQMVREEVDDMSDFELNRLCLEFPELEHLQLPAETLFDSAKMCALKELLPSLSVRIGVACVLPVLESLSTLKYLSRLPRVLYCAMY